MNPSQGSLEQEENKASEISPNKSHDSKGSTLFYFYFFPLEKFHLFFFVYLKKFIVFSPTKLFCTSFLVDSNLSYFNIEGSYMRLL